MKSATGFILSLVGGIFDILLGFIGILIAILLILVISGFDIGAGPVEMADLSTTVVLIFIGVSLWFIVVGIMTIIFSVKINNTENVKSGAIGCAIFGIITLNILTIIGSIFAFYALREIAPQVQNI
ncbi:MAG: hypothetical protein WCP89_01185 [archaeon]